MVCLLPACLPLCVPVSLSAFLLVSLTACVKKKWMPTCLCSDRVFLCPDNFVCVLKALISVKSKCPRVQFACSLCMPNTSIYTQTQKDQELYVKQLASQSFRVHFQTTDDSQIFRPRCNYERHNATLSGSLWFQHRDRRTQKCVYFPTLLAHSNSTTLPSVLRYPLSTTYPGQFYSLLLPCPPPPPSPVTRSSSPSSPPPQPCHPLLLSLFPPPPPHPHPFSLERVFLVLTPNFTGSSAGPIISLLRQNIIFPEMCTTFNMS